MCENCPTLTRIWNFIIILLLHTFVTYSSVKRYVELKQHIITQRHGIDWNQFLLQNILSSLIISNTLFFMYIITLFTRNGYFSCHESVGGRTSFISAHTDVGLTIKRHTTSWLQDIGSMIMHPSLHPGIFLMMSAYILLIPIPWIIGEQIKNGVKPPDHLWQTDLSFLFPPRPFRSQLTSFAGLDPTMKFNHGTVATALFSIQPPALGGLGQLPQTEEQLNIASRFRWNPDLGRLHTSLTDAINHPPTTQRAPISVEFINFILASIFVASNLPAMFWHTSRLYACFVSSLIAMTGLQLALDYAATGLLIKYAICLFPAQNVTTLTGRQSMQNSELKASLMLIQSPVQHPTWLLITLNFAAFFPTVLCVQLTQWISPINQLITDRKPEFGGNSERNILSETTWSQMDMKQIQPVSRSLGWRPISVIFLGFMSTILASSLRIPVQMELVRVVQKNGDLVCLTSLILYTIQFTVWILFWIGLLLYKQCNLLRLSTVDVKASFNNSIDGGTTIHRGAHQTGRKTHSVSSNGICYSDPVTGVLLTEPRDKSLYCSLQMNKHKHSMANFFQSLVTKNWDKKAGIGTTCSTIGIAHLDANRGQAIPISAAPGQSHSLDNFPTRKSSMEMKSPTLTVFSNTVRPSVNHPIYLSRSAWDEHKDHQTTLPRPPSMLDVGPTQTNHSHPDALQYVTTQRDAVAYFNPASMGSDCLISCSENGSIASPLIGAVNTAKCELTFFNGLDHSSSDGSTLGNHRYTSLTRAFKQRHEQLEQQATQCSFTHVNSGSLESNESPYRLHEKHKCVVSVESFPRPLTTIELDHASNAEQVNAVKCSSPIPEVTCCHETNPMDPTQARRILNHWQNRLPEGEVDYQRGGYNMAPQTPARLSHTISETGLCSQV